MIETTPWSRAGLSGDQLREVRRLARGRRVFLSRLGPRGPFYVVGGGPRGVDVDPIRAVKQALAEGSDA